jgi:nucleotide-binding universal stress UspA family protein
MPFKRILCGVDFSKESIRAFHAAVELARRGKAALHVLHVLEAQPVIPGWLPPSGLSEVTLLLEEKATASMEKLVKPGARELKGLKITSEVNDGRAFVEILDRARDWKADLIVIGAKGAASVDEIVAGGTAENVMRKATCSVLIVR